MLYRSISLVSAVFTALTALPPTLAAQNAEQAGVAAAVRGDVTLVAAVPAGADRAVGKNLGSGARIFLGDEISTGPNSGMQIMLLDETVFTIGPNAGLIIDEFVYDPATSAGQVTASVVKGAFRFVSGRVAKEQPSNMNVRTPVGTIGIRGTSAAGVITLPDPNNPGGTVSGTFVLLGPGSDNNAGERAGRILVTNGGTTVEITRSGFGTIISSPDLPPGTPVRLNPAEVAALTGGLGTDGGARPGTNGGEGPSQNGNTGAGGSQAGDLSGQTLGNGVTNAGFLTQVGDTQNQANQQADQAAQDINNSFVNTTVSTFDQLRSVDTGTATFSFGTVPLVYVSGPDTASSGSFNAQAFIDFGARTLDLSITDVTYTFSDGGESSNKTFVFTPNDSGSTNAFDNSSYENESGAVSETWSSQANSSNFPTPPTDDSLVVISASILNNIDANVIAAQGVVSMSITSDDTDTVIAGGATANAVAGSSESND